MRVLIHDFGAYPFCLELSREIARRGFRVQHAYFPSASAGMQNAEARTNDPPELEIVPLGDGRPYSRGSFFRRRSQEVAFGRALADHIRSWKPDVVVSANAPLEVQKRALQASRQVGARFVYWLQDLISVAMADVLGKKLGRPGLAIAGYYGRVERACARNSDAIVSISEDFLPVILQDWGIPPSQCRVIENWAPKDEIRPLPKDNPWSRRHNLADKKVLLYAGRLGFKQNPELLLEIAKSYRTSVDVAVVVVAEGDSADWLLSRKTEMGIESLHVLPFQHYSDLPHVLATADVLLCVVEASASRYSVPSKILTYLSAGRAILAAVPADNPNARHVARAGAGEICDPENVQAVIAAARGLMDNHERQAQCASRARAYAEIAFDIKTIANRFLQVIAPAWSPERVAVDWEGSAASPRAAMD